MMSLVFAPQFAGPGDPLPATPVRLPGGVRRTTTIDVHRIDDLYGPSTIDARGRDLVTDVDGGPIVVAEARLEGEVDGERSLRRLDAGDPAPSPGSNPPDTSAPSPAALASLLGATVAGGFRARVVDALADHLRDGTLWHLLVDDLVGAVLVSGVAPQHAEALAGGGQIVELTRAFEDVMFATMSDLCAGWASDATMLTEYRRQGALPVALGPAAPELDRDDDAWSWHEVAPLRAHGVRRRRRIDLGPDDRDGTAAFDVHFRDSHADGDGLERSVHEYTLRGRLDVAAGRIVEIVSEARVLPWRECPGAVASASRAVGVPLGEIRDHVRASFHGTSTCTHLNDTVRSLADLGVLAEQRTAAPDRR